MTEDQAARFASMDPRTGEVVGYHRIDDEAAVRTSVARARQAAAWWGGIGFEARKRKLLAWRARLARSVDELARVISAETGKPRDDARLECVLVI
ncbi:MAG: aldehyde dehydrogenase family protein, partial [Pseudonocardiaceae bacterium]